MPAKCVLLGCLVQPSDAPRAPSKAPGKAAEEPSSQDNMSAVIKLYNSRLLGTQIQQLQQKQQQQPRQQEKLFVPCSNEVYDLAHMSAVSGDNAANITVKPEVHSRRLTKNATAKLRPWNSLRNFWYGQTLNTSINQFSLFALIFTTCHSISTRGSQSPNPSPFNMYKMGHDQLGILASNFLFNICVIIFLECIGAAVRR